jgi:hypothetical protein
MVSFFFCKIVIYCRALHGSAPDLWLVLSFLLMANKIGSSAVVSIKRRGGQDDLLAKNY